MLVGLDGRFLLAGLHMSDVYREGEDLLWHSLDSDVASESRKPGCVPNRDAESGQPKRISDSPFPVLQLSTGTDH